MIFPLISIHKNSRSWKKKNLAQSGVSTVIPSVTYTGCEYTHTVKINVNCTTYMKIHLLNSTYHLFWVFRCFFFWIDNMSYKIEDVPFMSEIILCTETQGESRTLLKSTQFDFERIRSTWIFVYVLQLSLCLYLVSHDIVSKNLTKLHELCCIQFPRCSLWSIVKW